MAIQDHLHRIRNLQTATWQITSREDMWRGLLERVRLTETAFIGFIDGHARSGEVSLARCDVRNIYARDAKSGLIAAIIWAHARGIRVNALSLLARDLINLVDLFNADDFDETRISTLLGQPGISIPTASKMLSGCGKTFGGRRAAIIDDTIIQLIERPEYANDFCQIHAIAGKSRSRPIPYYDAYINDVTAITKTYGIAPDLLDRFLFEQAQLGMAENNSDRRTA